MRSIPSQLQRHGALALLILIFLIWLLSVGGPALVGPSPGMIPIFAFFIATLIYWGLQTWGLWREQPYLWWYGLGRAFLLTGVWGTAIGFMNVMSQLDRPQTIGPGLWISHFSLLWALVLYLCCLAKAPLQKNYRSDGDMEVEATFMNSGMPFFLFIVFVVLFALKP